MVTINKISFLNIHLNLLIVIVGFNINNYVGYVFSVIALGYLIMERCTK